MSKQQIKKNIYNAICLEAFLKKKKKSIITYVIDTEYTVFMFGSGICVSVSFLYSVTHAGSVLGAP